MGLCCQEEGGVAVSRAQHTNKPESPCRSAQFGRALPAQRGYEVRPEQENYAYRSPSYVLARISTTLHTRDDGDPDGSARGQSGEQKSNNLW